MPSTSVRAVAIAGAADAPPECRREAGSGKRSRRETSTQAVKPLLYEVFSPLVADELRARGDVVAVKEREDWQSLSHPEVLSHPLAKDIPAWCFLQGSFRPTRAAIGKIVAGLELRRAEYPGDEDLANGETWISAGPPIECSLLIVFLAVEQVIQRGAHVLAKRPLVRPSRAPSDPRERASIGAQRR